MEKHEIELQKKKKSTDFNAITNKILNENGPLKIDITSEEEGDIEVIIDMWKWIFGQWSSISTWLLDEIKKINNEYKAINARTRANNKKMTLIDDDSNNITMALITSKLDDIIAHKVLIAEKT